MAQPRVFVSSTYYDLKYVRSSLELFIESLGYSPVLSEKGSIAYAPDLPLDESCYREVLNCDIYLLIIGGRYGSEVSETRSEAARGFFERYESITKQEYKAAVDKDIPIYILIEKSVNAEYQTFRKNRDNSSITYAHVDSVNVFFFIEEILSKPRNNPVHDFDRYSEIEEWLRDQWAGLFRDLLLRRSGQQQIASLSSQVSELSEVNKTLRRYLEEVISKVSPDDASKIIGKETERLAQSEKRSKLESAYFVRLMKDSGAPIEAIETALERARSPQEFVEIIVKHPGTALEAQRQLETYIWPGYSRAAFEDLNEARAILDKPSLIRAGEANHPAIVKNGRRRQSVAKPQSMEDDEGEADLPGFDAIS